MSTETAPEPDRVEGAPHPRETFRLFGQEAAETTFLTAFASKRLHHAWLLNGPRGVGKATLAWRIARFLLATPDHQEGGLFGEAPAMPDTLDVAPDHPVARRIQAGAEPGLYYIRRTVNDKTGRLRDQILAENVRDLHRFLGLSAADGGRRVVIIDAADEMNVQAANALLKMLEEPPARTTFLLVSHQPAGLLPTIRSRCRDLRLMPLEPADMEAALVQAGIEAGGQAPALAQLSRGSAGEAVRMYNLDGLRIYGELIGIAATLPQLDRPRAIQMAEAAAARGAETRLDLLYALVDLFLSRLARSGATGTPPPEAVPGEAAVIARLAPDVRAARLWAECAQEIGVRSRHGRAVNLDPAALVLDTVFKLQQAAQTA